jgi:AGZA family xanthine/uracil permease-like MFS transporter
MLEQLFKLSENKTTVRTEIVAGITTFLTMAYIIFVNPDILSKAGMPFGAVFAATCVAAAIGCLLMAFLANYPIALAPGMGLNAYFAFVVVGQMKYSWQVALGCVFLSGILFFIISVLPIREWIVNAIPRSLKMAIAAGIGLFLALIALKNAGVVVANPATMVAQGDLKSWPVLMATLGFALIVALEYRKVLGGVIIGILAVTIVSIIAGQQKFGGIFDVPPSIAPVFLQMDLGGALKVGLVTGGLRLPVRRSVRQYRDTDRARPSWRLHAARWHRTASQSRADLRQRGGDDRRGGRHLDDNQLHRERIGHQRRRSHGIDGAHRRVAVPARAVSSRRSPVPFHPTRRRRRFCMSPA